MLFGILLSLLLGINPIKCDTFQTNPFKGFPPLVSPGNQPSNINRNPFRDRVRGLQGDEDLVVSEVCQAFFEPEELKKLAKIYNKKRLTYSSNTKFVFKNEIYRDSTISEFYAKSNKTFCPKGVTFNEKGSPSFVATDKFYKINSYIDVTQYAYRISITKNCWLHCRFLNQVDRSYLALKNQKLIFFIIDNANPPAQYQDSCDYELEVISRAQYTKDIGQKDGRPSKDSEIGQTCEKSTKEESIGIQFSLLYYDLNDVETVEGDSTKKEVIKPKIKKIGTSILEDKMFVECRNPLPEGIRYENSMRFYMICKKDKFEGQIFFVKLDILNDKYQIISIFKDQSTLDLGDIKFINLPTLSNGIQIFIFYHRTGQLVKYIEIREFDFHVQRAEQFSISSKIPKCQKIDSISYQINNMLVVSCIATNSSNTCKGYIAGPEARKKEEEYQKQLSTSIISNFFVEILLGDGLPRTLRMQELFSGKILKSFVSQTSKNPIFVVLELEKFKCRQIQNDDKNGNKNGDETIQINEFLQIEIYEMNANTRVIKLIKVHRIFNDLKIKKGEIDEKYNVMKVDPSTLFKIQILEVESYMISSSSILIIIPYLYKPPSKAGEQTPTYLHTGSRIIKVNEVKVLSLPQNLDNVRDVIFDPITDQLGTYSHKHFTLKNDDNKTLDLYFEMQSLQGRSFEISKFKDQKIQFNQSCIGFFDQKDCSGPIKAETDIIDFDAFFYFNTSLPFAYSHQELNFILDNTWSSSPQTVEIAHYDNCIALNKLVKLSLVRLLPYEYWLSQDIYDVNTSSSSKFSEFWKEEVREVQKALDYLEQINKPQQQDKQQSQYQRQSQQQQQQNSKTSKNKDDINKLIAYHFQKTYFGSIKIDPKINQILTGFSFSYRLKYSQQSTLHLFNHKSLQIQLYSNKNESRTFKRESNQQGSSTPKLKQVLVWSYKFHIGLGFEGKLYVINASNFEFRELQYSGKPCDKISIFGPSFIESLLVCVSEDLYFSFHRLNLLVQSFTLSSKLLDFPSSYFDSQFVEDYRLKKVDFEIDSFDETTTYDGCIFLMLRGQKTTEYSSIMIRLRIDERVHVESPVKLDFSGIIKQFGDLSLVVDQRIRESVIVMLMKNYLGYTLAFIELVNQHGETKAEKDFNLTKLVTLPENWEVSQVPRYVFGEEEELSEKVSTIPMQMLDCQVDGLYNGQGVRAKIALFVSSRDGTRHNVMYVDPFDVASETLQFFFLQRDSLTQLQPIPQLQLLKHSVCKSLGVLFMKRDYNKALYMGFQFSDPRFYLSPEVLIRQYKSKAKGDYAKNIKGPLESDDDAKNLIDPDKQEISGPVNGKGDQQASDSSKLFGRQSSRLYGQEARLDGIADSSGVKEPLQNSSEEIFKLIFDFVELPHSQRYPLNLKPDERQFAERKNPLSGISVFINKKITVEPEFTSSLVQSLEFFEKKRKVNLSYPEKKTIRRVTNSIFEGDKIPFEVEIPAIHASQKFNFSVMNLTLTNFDQGDQSQNRIELVRYWQLKDISGELETSKGNQILSLQPGCLEFDQKNKMKCSLPIYVFSNSTQLFSVEKIDDLFLLETPQEKEKEIDLRLSRNQKCSKPAISRNRMIQFCERKTGKYCVITDMRNGFSASFKVSLTNQDVRNSRVFYWETGSQKFILSQNVVGRIIKDVNLFTFSEQPLTSRSYKNRVSYVGDEKCETCPLENFELTPIISSNIDSQETFFYMEKNRRYEQFTMNCRFNGQCLIEHKLRLNILPQNGKLCTEIPSRGKLFRFNEESLTGNPNKIPNLLQQIKIFRLDAFNWRYRNVTRDAFVISIPQHHSFIMFGAGFHNNPFKTAIYWRLQNPFVNQLVSSTPNPICISWFCIVISNFRTVSHLRLYYIDNILLDQAMKDFKRENETDVCQAVDNNRTKNVTKSRSTFTIESEEELRFEEEYQKINITDILLKNATKKARLLYPFDTIKISDSVKQVEFDSSRKEKGKVSILVYSTNGRIRRYSIKQKLHLKINQPWIKSDHLTLRYQTYGKGSKYEMKIGIENHITRPIYAFLRFFVIILLSLCIVGALYYYLSKFNVMEDLEDNESEIQRGQSYTKVQDVDEGGVVVIEGDDHIGEGDGVTVYKGDEQVILKNSYQESLEAKEEGDIMEPEVYDVFDEKEDQEEQRGKEEEKEDRMMEDDLLKSQKQEDPKQTTNTVMSNDDDDDESSFEGDASDTTSSSSGSGGNG